MTLSLATVAPAFIPGPTHPRYSSSLAYAGLPHTNEHLSTMRLSPSCSHPPCCLQDRDEIADDVIIVKSRNRYVKVTTISVHPLDINPRATVASIQVLFRGINVSIQPHFALSYAWLLGILRY